MGVGAVALVSAPAGACRLRPMLEADLDRVVEIEEGWAPKPWSRKTFRNELGVPFSRGVVAHPHGEPNVVCGYLVRWLVAGEVHLLSIAVASAFRRRGIGSRMLDDLLQEAREESAELITLEVEAANDTAVRLYKSRGFEQVRRRTSYYGSGRDALVLEQRF